MPLSFGVELLAMLDFSSLAVSPAIVDVDGEREKEFKGPRCVSLSSRMKMSGLVIFEARMGGWQIRYAG